MKSVALPPRLRARLVAWSRQRAPREACGILVGARVSDCIEIVRACACVNRSTIDDTFALDPGEIVAVARAARASGLDIVAFWHAHAEGPAVPSSRDGAWPGFACVVVSPQALPAVRAWRMQAGAIEELGLEDQTPGNRRRRAHNARLRPLDPARPT